MPRATAVSPTPPSSRRSCSTCDCGNDLLLGRWRMMTSSVPLVPRGSSSGSGTLQVRSAADLLASRPVSKPLVSKWGGRAARPLSCSPDSLDDRPVAEQVVPLQQVDGIVHADIRTIPKPDLDLTERKGHRGWIGLGMDRGADCSLPWGRLVTPAPCPPGPSRI